MQTAVEWRTIAEAPDYEVSNIGTVRRAVPDWQGKYAGRELKPSFVRGYARVVLCANGSKRSHFVHSLVCAAFNGPRPPDKAHCAHKDDDKANNRPENLYWATARENCEDRARNGRTARGEATKPKTKPLVPWQHLRPECVLRGEAHSRKPGDPRWPRGERMPAAKLSREDAEAILTEAHYHGVGRDLARRYGVSMGLISQIRKGKAWVFLTASDTASAPPDGGA